jgi:isopropylmalate/homocitrate/citramalate synthase
MLNFKTSEYWVSPYDYADDVRGAIHLPQKIEIHDATLRDGEQTPGIVLSVAEKVEIAKMLDSIGIDRIETGMPAVSEEDKEAIKEITALGLHAKIFTFARAKREDIDMAVECHADGVIIEVPTSVPKLTYQFPKWSHDDVIKMSVDIVSYAKSKGLEAVFFGYDTTRADFDFLMKLYDHVINEGHPDSIGIVDTMGCALPAAMAYLVREVKKRFSIKVEVHAHNDYGMAVATSFAAVEAGAEVIHVCANGLGERTGNAALEPVLVGLKTLYGIPSPYHLEKLKAVSDRIEEITHFPKAVNLPFVGKNVYVRESGIGIDLVEEQPLAMFAVVPGLVGNKSGVVLGKKSGTKSIDVMLEKCGLDPIDDKDLKQRMLHDIKEFSISHKKLLDTGEFLTIVRQYVKQGGKNENL